MKKLIVVAVVTEITLQPLPGAVAEALRRIVQTVQPARVVAFGSRARGDHRPDSDLDLLVILPAGNDPTGVSADLYEAIGGLGFAKDIVVTEAVRFERMRLSPNSVQAEAAREGVTLYEHGRTDLVTVAKVCR